MSEWYRASRMTAWGELAASQELFGADQPGRFGFRHGGQRKLVVADHSAQQGKVDLAIATTEAPGR